MRSLHLRFDTVRVLGGRILVALLLACAAATGGEHESVGNVGAPSTMGRCSATIEQHGGPPRLPFAEITSVVVRCEDTEGVVLRLVGSETSLNLRWTGDQNLLIRLDNSGEVLSRSTSMGDVGIEYDPALPESDVIYGELPRSEWLSSCVSGARQVVSQLPEESRTIIRELSDSELREMRLYWGAMLARHFALYNGNFAMLESCGGAAATAGTSIVDLVATSIRTSGEEEE